MTYDEFHTLVNASPDYFKRYLLWYTRENRYQAFEADVALGNFGESRVAALLSGDGVEVKTQTRAGYTGNVALEVANSRGEAKGVAATKADWLAFVFDGVGYDGELVIFIKTDRLRNLMERFAFQPRASWKFKDGRTDFQLMRLADLVSRTNTGDR